MSLKNFTRFRLGSILLLMLLCGVGFAALNWQLQWYRNQRHLASEIGDRAYYLEMQPGTPEWLGRFALPENFVSIKVLSFQNRRQFSNDDLELVAKAKQLRLLSLQHTVVNDAGMERISRLKLLDTLSLVSTDIGDEGLAKLAGLTSLIKLQLSHSKVTGAGLKHLAAMENLQELELVGLDIRDEDLQHLESLKSLKSLKSLRISSTELRGPGLASLQKLKDLQTILISSSKFASIEIADMPSLETVVFFGKGYESLVIRNCLVLTKLYFRSRSPLESGPPDVHLENLPLLDQLRYSKMRSLFVRNLKSLTELNLGGQDLAELELEGLPALDQLTVNGTVLPPDAMENLPVLPKLTLVHLGRVQVETRDGGYRGFLPRDLAALSRHRNLSSISISGRIDDPATLQGIVDQPKLKTLSLSDCEISDEHLAGFKLADQLERLYLVNSPAFEGKVLGKLPLDKLVSLNLNRCQLSPAGFEQIGKLKKLVVLDVFQTPLTDNDARHLIHLYDLKYAQLNGTSLTDVGFNHLLCLPELELRYRDMMRTKISDEKARQFRDRPVMNTGPTPKVTY